MLRGFSQHVPERIKTFSIDVIRALLRSTFSISHAVADFEFFSFCTHHQVVVFSSCQCWLKSLVLLESWVALPFYPRNHSELWISLPILSQWITKSCGWLHNNCFKILNFPCLIAKEQYAYIVYCNTLQHTTTHCNSLQNTAKHCNTLQQSNMRILL